MPADRLTTYWAALPFSADELGGHLMEKIEDYFHSIEANGLRSLWELSAQMYQAGATEHVIDRIGEQGEFDYVGINHYRNIGQHTVVSIIGSRVGLYARASNTDFTSRSQARACDGLFEYYRTVPPYNAEEKHAAVIEAVTKFGESFRYMRWDPRKGELVGIDEARPFDQVASLAGGALGQSNVPAVSGGAGQGREGGGSLAFGGEGFAGPGNGAPLYAGDVLETNPAPVDVIREPTARSWSEVNWVIIRERHNRWDVAALFPQLRDRIVDAPDAAEERLDRRTIEVLRTDSHNYQSDEIYVYTFLHDRTPAMVNGRIVCFIDADTMLEETDFEEAGVQSLELMLNRVSGGEIEGTAHGYSFMFDILAPCKALNIAASTALTNLSNHGVTNLTGPAGMEAETTDLARGLRFVSTKGVREGKIEVLDLLNIPDEIFKFAEWVVGSIETTTGVNSVTRGNPEASLKSGTALALVQSQFLEFTKGLQAASAQAWERWGLSLVQIFKRNVPEPRLAAIVGKGNTAYAKELKAEDIEAVDRVFCEVGSYLSRTAAGRVNLAEQLLGAGLLKSAQDFMFVLENGRLDGVIHDETDELLLIEAENELMQQGELPTVLATDNDPLHITKHKKTLMSPEARLDQNVVTASLAHIQEHINSMMTKDPALAAIIGQAAPPAPGGPAGMSSPENVPPGGGPADTANIPLEAANPATGDSASVSMPADAAPQ